jgi:hypothetical protein
MMRNRHSRHLARRGDPRRSCDRDAAFCMSFMPRSYALRAFDPLTPTQLGITIGCGGLGALRARARWPRRATLGPAANPVGARRGAAAQVLIPLAPRRRGSRWASLITTQGSATERLPSTSSRDSCASASLPPEALASRGRDPGKSQPDC